MILFFLLHNNRIFSWLDGSLSCQNKAASTVCWFVLLCISDVFPFHPFLIQVLLNNNAFHSIVHLSLSHKLAIGGGKQAVNVKCKVVGIWSRCSKDTS